MSYAVKNCPESLNETIELKHTILQQARAYCDQYSAYQQDYKEEVEQNNAAHRNGESGFIITSIGFDRNIKLAQFLKEQFVYSTHFDAEKILLSLLNTRFAFLNERAEHLKKAKAMTTTIQNTHYKPEDRISWLVCDLTDPSYFNTYPSPVQLMVRMCIDNYQLFNKLICLS